MELRDSRRLTGPNLLMQSAGAVLDVSLSADEAPRAVAVWEEQARRLLDALGWGAQILRSRSFPEGASLALSAPLDALYAATEVNEAAWEAARAVLAGATPNLDEDVLRLRGLIREERNPALLEMRDAAHKHGVAFLCDDDFVSIGMGASSRTWAAREVPAPGAVAWGEIADVPIALVTGTNGKTTTVRLLARMLAGSDRIVGSSSTDEIRISGEVVEAGDWSGPGGGRFVLRDRRVEAAVLETARGGLLRRGLAVERADVGVITNIAADHLGEWGVGDMQALVDAKFVISRACARLVLNADDPLLAARGRKLAESQEGAPRVIWFSTQAPFDTLRSDQACVLEDGHLVAYRNGRRDVLAAADAIPLSLGGAARHNVANALAATAAALAMGTRLHAVRDALASFGSRPGDNRGRQNVFQLGGVTAIVDFAHNPHGLDALLETAARMPAARRLVLLGQAGDRDDEAILELARSAARARPDRVILKRMVQFQRGRAVDDVERLLAAELSAAGLPEDRIELVASEFEGVRSALAWARSGDLLVLLAHAERGAVLDLLERLVELGWEPGADVLD